MFNRLLHMNGRGNKLKLTWRSFIARHLTLQEVMLEGPGIFALIVSEIYALSGSLES